MGYIDKTEYALNCDCGETESQTIFEKGSQYHARWEDGKPFDKFAVTWKTGDFGSPKVTRAICNKCGKSPTVSVT